MTIIAKEELQRKGQELYVDYSVHVIEDRAIYGEIDGLKPVTRRALWAAHKLGLRHNTRHDKSAKIVGEAIANYHPHGDVALYSAVVTAANSPVPLFDGDGNFGTMNDPAAAMRYTNARLSKYADTVFFDKFYLPVIDMVPNYDDSREEPLILPTLLPNALINGNFGIAPGVRTQTPSFTIDSLVPVIVKALKEGGCDPKSCLKLEFTTEYSGVLRKDTPKKELLALYKTGKGKFVFDSSYTVSKKGNEIRFDRFAPFSNIETVLGKVENIKGVTYTRDDSTKSDKYLVAYTVGFQKNLKGKALDAVISKVVDAFSSNVSFDIKSVKRFLDPKKVTGGRQLSSATIPELIDIWIDYRIKLEKKACTYWISKRRDEIAYLNLMRLAVKNRKFIIKALDKKLDDEGLANYIAKGLKITIDQANLILDLKVRQLKALEDTKLVAKIKELKAEIEGYNTRIKKPKSYIAKQIIGFQKALNV